MQKTTKRIFAILLSVLFFLGSNLHASPPTEIKLVPEKTLITPGEPINIAIKIKLAPGWHTYADPPGDSGLPAKITWTGLDRLSPDKIQYPPHKKIKYGDLINNGYKEKVTLNQSIKFPEKLPEGPIKLTAKTRILICKDECIPYTSPQTLTFTTQAQQASSTSASPLTLTIALVFAFLGGIILNIMPCVFPVLSIKIFSLIGLKNEEESTARKHGLAYTAGILTTFTLIASILIALKAGGKAVGWGFQLQNPIVIIALIVLTILMGLNLLGVFEIGLSLTGLGSKFTQKKGLWGPFFTGVFATTLATPCTAPFMATALGFAITQPPAISLLIFLSLGLGLAFPFLLLSYIPALRSKLPKPGKWMETIKKALSIPMFLTSIWLIWVFLQQLNTAPAFSELNLKDALNTPNPVFVEMTADWCITCQVNKKVALERPEIKALFQEKQVIMIIGDWTNEDPNITTYLEKNGRSGVPFYKFYPAPNPESGERPDPIILPQVLSPQALKSILNQ